jgi:hypothetical protein
MVVFKVVFSKQCKFKSTAAVITIETINLQND